MRIARFASPLEACHARALYQAELVGRLDKVEKARSCNFAKPVQRLVFDSPLLKRSRADASTLESAAVADEPIFSNAEMIG